MRVGLLLDGPNGPNTVEIQSGLAVGDWAKCSQPVTRTRAVSLLSSSHRQRGSKRSRSRTIYLRLSACIIEM